MIPFADASTAALKHFTVMFAVFRTPRSPVFHPSPWFASELALPACFRASRTQTGSSARLSTCSRCAPPVSLPGTPACDWPVPSYLLPGVRRRDADSFRKGEERRKHGSEETRLRRCSSTAGVAAAPRGQMRRRMRVRPPAAPVAAPAGDLAAEDYFRGRVRRYAPSAAFRELQPSSELPRPELCGVCTLKARPRFFFSAVCVCVYTKSTPQVSFSPLLPPCLTDRKCP